MKKRVVRKQRILLYLPWVLSFIFLITTSILFFQQRDTSKESLTFLAPSIETMDIDTFKTLQAAHTNEYSPLRKELIDYMDEQNVSRYSIYVEDLRTGAWMGVNEKEKFKPASLFKLPTLAAIFKSVETTNLSIHDTITITPSDISLSYGPVGEKGANYDYQIIDLVNYTIYYSDNTAHNALRRQLEPDVFADAVLGLGIPYSVRKDVIGNTINISAKDYSNIFRSLYYSTYLKRPYSNTMLEFLAHTYFDEGLPSGVPKDVTVSHKIGESKGFIHDCGIVYAPHEPYILCFMSEGMEPKQAITIIETISNKVYFYTITH